MKLYLSLCASLATFASAAAPQYNSRAFDGVLSKRQTSTNVSSDLIVDLGYEQYMGVANASTGLNTFKGWKFYAEHYSKTRLI